MRRLLDRKAWEGPVGIARIVVLLSATWLFVTGLLLVIGVSGWTPARAVLPSEIMLLALGFLFGYQMGLSKRP